MSCIVLHCPQSALLPGGLPSQHKGLTYGMDIGIAVFLTDMNAFCYFFVCQDCGHAGWGGGIESFTYTSFLPDAPLVLRRPKEHLCCAMLCWHWHWPGPW